LDNRNKRLTLLTQDFFPNRGGLQEYLFEVAQRLGETIEVSVLTPVDGPLPPGCRFRRVVASSLNPFHLWRHLRRLSPDVLLLGHARLKMFLAGQLWGGYATVTYGNDFIAAQKRWHRPLFNALMRRSSPLMVNSNAMGERLQALGMQHPVVVLPGANPDRLAPAESPPPDPVLLTVSRLVSRKGIDTVLLSLPALLEEFPNLCYQIGGKGPERESLEALANDLGVARAVRFLGFVPDEALPDLYRSASVFVMPTREEVEASSVEGFGIVYLEASASGLPVVAASSGGAVEAVRDGQTGLLVPPDDPARLAEALGTLLREPELCRRLGRNGRRWVETEMNWDRAAREIREALFG
jgi:phosphatidylinositol alpha-1,6-mannosyltransferase